MAARITDDQDRQALKYYVESRRIRLPVLPVAWDALFLHADNVRFIAKEQRKALPAWFVTKYHQHFAEPAWEPVLDDDDWRPVWLD